MVIWKLAFLLGCLLISSVKAQTGQPDCLAIPGLEAEPCDYIDGNGDAQSIEKDTKACIDQAEHCCWDSSAEKCRNKITGPREPPGGNVENPFDLPKSDDIVKNITRSVQSRNLVILNPLCIPTGPLPFPSECKFVKSEPYVLDPPTNAPYCFRIPCSLDTVEQSKLDKSHFACGSTPGCYFDVELYEYREAFGPAVLAGVPVCHLAIRNSVFLREANKVRDEVGSWTPYFTNCLLNTFSDEINEGPSGCLLIPLLRTFNILPKLAGWEGITTKECVLIDGCWSNSYGCQYPVDINNIIVKSGQRFIFSKFDVVYGRPKCQHFNMENSYEILKSYHRCLASGCTVDVTISANYHQYLFDIGDQMSVRDHWHYWTAVLKDRIGSFNLDTDIYWKYDRTFSGSLEADTTVPPTTTTTTTRNLFDWRLLLLAAAARRQSQPSPTLFAPSQACGFAFPGLNNRPCRPVPPPNLRPNTHCPYKPFFVPRFKPLKGSFKGCCEINHCYISRQDIRKMHSGPSVYYTEWSSWDGCSGNCGVAEMEKRSRRCVSHDKDLCDLKVEEERPCPPIPCSEWTQWGGWPRCPRGRRARCSQVQRFRQCHPDPNGCVRKGQAVENKLCNCRSNRWGG